MLLFAAAVAAVHSFEAEAKSFFANQSVNPSATQFRDVRKVTDVVCGEINRPNREGGYDGFVRFVYRTSDTWALQLPGGYRLSDKGKFTDASLLIDEARYRPGMTTEELKRASDLLQQATAANDKGSNMIQPCLG
jgi:hypothetical protein